MGAVADAKPMNEAQPLSAWIGRRAVREDVVTARLADAYRATLAPRLFVPASPDEAPPGLHWCLAVPTPADTDLGPDGSEARGSFLPPAPLPRRMWAGGEVEMIAPIRIGATIRRTTTIADIQERQGRSGRLCFVTVRHEIESDGVLAVRERQDLVFRETGRGATPVASARPNSDLIWQVDASPVLLFRFSALTFNGHRIHYDYPYATQTEGYGGLVVHGPLQADLLLNQAAVLLGAVPRRFSYRCTAPLIAGQPFEVLSARAAGHAATGAIADAGGVVTIEANAEL
ncbi:MAG: FAS1-like dehydratase domain-containing protein [Hyphomicrobiales bacterium]